MTSALAFAPGFLKGSSGKLFTGEENKHVVVVQLTGGNDGLNMVVPFRNDIYYSLRPEISVDSKSVLKLNDDLGLNPLMNGIYSLFQEGRGCLINNVGYPNPDHSHFRSMDIWHSASGSNNYIQSGWLGRYLDENCEHDCHPYNAIEVDDTLCLALKGEHVKGLSVKSPDQLFSSAGNKNIASIHLADHLSKNNNLDYLYKTLSETESSVGYLKKQKDKSHVHAEYPKGQFATNLQRIAQLIGADSDIRIYYVSLTGFDTHVNQTERQNKLLGELSEGISAFMNDLKTCGKENEILMMVFSEFGRRVKQNASNGTDHGTANNVLLFSGDLKQKGVYNEPPDLQKLDDGDLKFTIDFRSVYATVLRKWLGANDRTILGNTFEPLNFI